MAYQHGWMVFEWAEHSSNCFLSLLHACRGVKFQCQDFVNDPHHITVILTTCNECFQGGTPLVVLLHECWAVHNVMLLFRKHYII